MMFILQDYCKNYMQSYVESTQNSSAPLRQYICWQHFYFIFHELQATYGICLPDPVSGLKTPQPFNQPQVTRWPRKEVTFRELSSIKENNLTQGPVLVILHSLPTVAHTQLTTACLDGARYRDPGPKPQSETILKFNSRAPHGTVGSAEALLKPCHSSVLPSA